MKLENRVFVLAAVAGAVFGLMGGIIIGSQDAQRSAIDAAAARQPVAIRDVARCANMPAEDPQCVEILATARAQLVACRQKLGSDRLPGYPAPGIADWMAYCHEHFPER
jgi:hypothetical protein